MLCHKMCIRDRDSDGHALNMAGSTTLNSAIQKACGDNKAKFTLVVMHSTVATNLENLNPLAYLKQTDESGVQRDLGHGTWNGRIVLIDDSMPATEGYYPATAEEPGALLVKDSGASDGQINKSDVTPYFLSLIHILWCPVGKSTRALTGWKESRSRTAFASNVKESASVSWLLKIANVT